MVAVLNLAFCFIGGSALRDTRLVQRGQSPRSWYGGLVLFLECVGYSSVSRWTCCCLKSKYKKALDIRRLSICSSHHHQQVTQVHLQTTNKPTTTEMHLTTTLLPLLPFALAAPSSLTTRQTPGEILPTTIISHDLAWPPSPNVCLGPADRPSAYRRVQSGSDTGRSLLYTFTYPAASTGRQCWLEFTTTPPTTIRPNPGAQLDVFRQWAPGSCVAGAAGNNRDAQLGRLSVPASGTASWAAVYSGHLTSKGPCAAAGTVEGVEIVAVGDDGEVTFPQGAGSGLRIRYE